MTTVSAPAPAVAAHHHHHHQNDAAHSHDGPVESYPHVQGGPTVLDIGGDIGAMIVTMNAESRRHGAAPALGARAADLDPHRRLATGAR